MKGLQYATDSRACDQSLFVAYSCIVNNLQVFNFCFFCGSIKLRPYKQILSIIKFEKWNGHYLTQLILNNRWRQTDSLQSIICHSTKQGNRLTRNSTAYHGQISCFHFRKICAELISKLGANSVKDMGKVMGELKKLHSDEIDFAKAGLFIKELLNS